MVCNVLLYISTLTTIKCVNAILLILEGQNLKARMRIRVSIHSKSMSWIRKSIVVVSELKKICRNLILYKAFLNPRHDFTNLLMQIAIRPIAILILKFRPSKISSIVFTHFIVVSVLIYNRTLKTKFFMPIFFQQTTLIYSSAQSKFQGSTDVKWIFLA